MRGHNSKPISRQPQKVSAGRTVTRQAAQPAKTTVRANAPSRQTMTNQSRIQVKTVVPPPQCVPSSEGCHPPPVMNPCVWPPIHLSCLIFGDNIDPTTGLVKPGSPLDHAFPSPAQIAECTTTDSGCTISPTDAKVVSDLPYCVDNGEYSVIRIYDVTDSCGNCVLVAVKITFTISDGTGPNITISPPVGSIGLPQCSPGTNPVPPCGVPAVEPCSCECVFLPGCRPSMDKILAALGTATADGCDGKIISVVDEGPIRESECYSYMVRTFTAVDECCNESQACRVVRWLDDTINPTLTISPTLQEIQQQFPNAQPCVEGTNPEPNCECIDLGCNPPLGTYPTITALVDYVLGVGVAHDNCGPTQVCHKTSKINGHCCEFSQTRTFKATDPCGNNSAIVCRTVIWTINEEPPVLQCPGDKILPCGTPLNTLAQYFDTPSVFDSCNGCIETAVQAGADQPGTDSDGNKTLTRTWTATNSCGVPATHTVSQTLTVDCSTSSCDPSPPPSGSKGCSKGFWHNSQGQPTWVDGTNVVNNINRTLSLASPNGIPTFSQTQNALVFFAATGSSCGIPTNATLFSILTTPVQGSPCIQLVAQGVAALLGMSAFGYPAYSVPGYPGITDLYSLYLAIHYALVGNPSQGQQGCTCTDLASALETANTSSGDVHCNNAEINHLTPSMRPTLRTLPNNNNVQYSVAPQRLPLRKTFVPSNAY